MIFNIGATFGHNVRPGDHSRMCSEPIGTYTMSFRPFPTHTTHFDLFMLFSMIACLYRTDCYIDRLAMYSPYYSIPMRCISDPFRLFVDFIYLHSYRYSDVLVIYSFCWSHYCYKFGLWFLQTISHIRCLWHYFDLSEFIFTYILPTTPILHRTTLYLVPLTS